MNACLEEAVVVSHGRPHAQPRTKAAWNAGEVPAVSDLQTGVQSWVVFLQMAQAGCGAHAHVAAWVLEGDRAAVYGPAWFPVPAATGRKHPMPALVWRILGDLGDPSSVVRGAAMFPRASRNRSS